jgi:RNA polymerase sigma factor (sigma-70 family)
MKVVRLAAPLLDAAADVETDAQLVRRCLGGDEEAWNALIDRYKRLIYSIPFKYGATAEDAGDIFQSVCVDLITELPKLRKPEAVKSWLISVTRHKSLRWKQRARREVGWDGPEDFAETMPADDPNAAQVIEDVQRDQGVRQALGELPERCRALMQMLFFGNPPPPYAEVARKLGLATGSIGFIRGRCLKKLEAALKAQGF